ncbi:MAG: hypothetical protein ACI8QS_000307 [Planctomycetota bacterium]|jgi:hypothetical protein
MASTKTQSAALRRRTLPLLLTGLATFCSLASLPWALQDPDPQATETSAPNTTAQDVQIFGNRVQILAASVMEGRVPGTAGMELARDTVQSWMEETGVEPAFTVEGEASWRQPFELAPDVRLISQKLSFEGAELDFVADEDYRGMPYGSAGSASGKPVFIGYGIERGPVGSEYRGYVEGLDLTGKVAVMLRFEPMDAEGKSRFTTRGPWSGRAGFSAKLRAAAKRNPAAILILNPPGCSDPRSQQLMPFTSGRDVAGVPVLHVNLSAAEAMATALDFEGRSLLDLRLLADAGAVAIEWNGVITAKVETKSVALVAQNIGGLLRGKGALADELIVMGAHMDHLGMGEFGSRSGPGELHPGADDNATGTAAILMLAERLRRDYDAMPEGSQARSILFLAFDAEESGLNGSAYYVNNPIVPLKSHALMLNFDMIGRLTNQRLSVAGGGTGVGLADLLKPLFEATPLTIVQPAGSRGGSDHLPFLQRKIPILFAICADMHDDYHTPRDTSDKVNNLEAVQTIDLFYEILRATSVAPERWAWDESASSR